MIDDLQALVALRPEPFGLLHEASLGSRGHIINDRRQIGEDIIVDEQDVPPIALLRPATLAISHFKLIMTLHEGKV